MREYKEFEFRLKQRRIGHLLLAGGLALAFFVPQIAATPVQAEAVYDIKEMPRPDIPGLVISPDDPLQNLTARSAVVIDAASGQVIYERNKDERRFPASTTKIMTLILALEHSNMDDMVTVSSNAAGTEGSTLWLEAGEKIRMGDLLYGMMMHSGNDATVAVAEHIAGSVDKFAAMMTAKAHEIGAVNTNFANANGLPRDDHYTTAYDLAKITAYGYRVPGFEQIVSTKEIDFDWVKDPSHHLRNENQMLWLYRGANGVKTGYTDAAGRCLVSGAKKDGLQLVAVVLDSVYMWNDSIKLLDYGFAHVEPDTIVKEGDTVGYANVARRHGPQAAPEGCRDADARQAQGRGRSLQDAHRGRRPARAHQGGRYCRPPRRGARRQRSCFDRPARGSGHHAPLVLPDGLELPAVTGERMSA